MPHTKKCCSWYHVKIDCNLKRKRAADLADRERHRILLRLSRTEWLLLILFLTLLTFPLQYICRFLDMSTLTSWRWVFGEKGPAGVFLLLSMAVLLALPLSNSNLPERYPAALLFILSVLSVMPFLSSPEYLLDTARYFLQAKYLKIYGITAFLRGWGHEVSSWTDLPLVPLIYGILFKMFGETKEVIAFFNLLLFGFIPVITYSTGRLLWDRPTGFLAGMLMLASPYLLTQASLMLVDVHTIFFLLLSVWLFLCALERGGFLWLLASSLAIILALLSKYSTWPMLGILGIITLIRLDSRPWTILKRVLVVAILTGMMMGVIFYWKGDVIMQQITLLRTYQLSGLKKWQEGYTAAIFFQSHPYIIMAVLLGCYRALIRREKNIFIIAWFAGLAFFLELKRLRYLLPLLPFFVLTAAYGLQVINHARVRRYIVYCAVMWSLVISIWVYRPFLAGLSMSNLKHAGSFLNTLQTDAVEVFCLPQARSVANTSVAVPILDLYTNKIIYQEQAWKSVEGFQRAEKTSMRFTWELAQPAYYKNRIYADAKLPLVIISDKPVNNIPPQFLNKYPSGRLIGQFAETSKVFRFQTFVAVFDSL